jgi:hypothetical protein
MADFSMAAWGFSFSLFVLDGLLVTISSLAASFLFDPILTA